MATSSRYFTLRHFKGSCDAQVILQMIFIMPTRKVGNFKQEEKVQQVKEPLFRFGCFHGVSFCSVRRWIAAGARLASPYDKPVKTLCTSCFNIDIYLPVGLQFGWNSQKCISADLGKYFPETMSGLVGRGFARSSRSLLSVSAISSSTNLVHAVRIGVERMLIKSFEHCHHLNFSSSCSAGARLYTERHEWVTLNIHVA